MTQNPNGFEAGGFDLGAMLQQAQEMQAQLMQAQAELAATEIEGGVAGVSVTVNGTGEVVNVRFTAAAVSGTDEESLADLGDLVVAAYRDARAKSDALASEKLGPVTGALGGDIGGMLGGSPLV
jgi:DNA-binding protein YbaB